MANTRLIDRVDMDTGWKRSGACVGTDTATMFPDEKDLLGNAVALRICADCTVREECLAYALETNQNNGVWGGVSEIDRRQIRRKNLKDRRKAQGSAT